MLIINFPVPTNIKEVYVSVFRFLSSFKTSPALLYPVTDGFHVTLRTSPPLILMYKIGSKTAIL